jgi:arylsulfatase A-like enzyme
MPRRPSFLIVITDQQSGNPYWPDGWADENLPAMRWLKEHGIDFPRGYTNSCTCSPARATLLTGLYPAQHGMTEVLEFDNIARFASEISVSQGDDGSRQIQPQVQAMLMNVKERRQTMLSANVQNLAHVLRGAGYEVVFKGKWHLTKPAAWVRDPARGIDQKYWTQADVDQLAERFGFAGWTMPDAGDNLAIENMGGGDVRNDQRFVDGRGQAAKYGDVAYGALEPHSATHFLRTWQGERPLCLIVSLVNPHDVLSYPGTGAAAIDGVPLYQAAGYRDELFENLPIDRPPTWNEDLSTKPRAQSEFRVLANAGNGPITDCDEDAQLGYCRFYAHLCRHVDHQIVQVLDALRGSTIRDDTFIVRISDHGDMAMAHGLQRQKMFNVYEETLNVPFVIAHPHALTGGRTSNALVSLIDLLPTIATLAGVPDRDRWSFKGRDLTPVLSDPAAEVQDVLHFTYDDLYFFVPSASHVRAIVEKRWKYAVYYDPHTNAPFEYEMYDLAVPRAEREVVNLGNPATEVSGEVAAERERLHQRLIRVMDSLGTLPLGVEWPERWGEQPSARATGAAGFEMPPAPVPTV